MRRRAAPGGRGARRVLAAAAVGLLAGVVGGPDVLGAQAVIGTAVDAADGHPVSGAFVLLVDEGGTERARGLTTGSGTFRLGAAPGTYRLRLERIGFDDLETEPFTLARGETVRRDLRVAARAIQLSSIRVEGGEARCGMPADEALELSRVWAEARKALEATAWTDRQSYYRFDGLRGWQELDARGRPVGPPQYEPIRIYGRHPFRSVRPDDLAYGGWVQREGARGLKFHAPDADVLLSESFLSRHCYRLVRGDADPGRLGIEFEPLPDRRLSDISGVLWIDRQTAELYELEFRYENLELPVDTERLGGRVVFDRLPDGGWIVRSWEIRTPLARIDRARRDGARRQRIELAGMRVERQLVLAVWRTGDLQAAPGAVLPSDVAPVNPPPDEILKRYPPPGDLADDPGG